MVGYLLANRHPTFFANGPVVWIEEVMVDEERRGRGIGRKPMRFAESWAREARVAYVALATRRAADFYAALGYTGVGDLLPEGDAALRRAWVEFREPQPTVVFDAMGPVSGW